MLRSLFLKSPSLYQDSECLDNSIMAFIPAAGVILEIGPLKSNLHLVSISDSINLLDNLRRRAIFAQKSIFEKVPGINGGTSSLASKKANSSGFLFWNVESSSISTTLIVEKIDKIEILIIDGKVTLLEDEDGPFQPKKPAEGDAEAESHWTQNKRGWPVQTALKDHYVIKSKEGLTMRTPPDPKKDFQENSDDECLKASNQSLLQELIQSSSNSIIKLVLKYSKDYKAEYKKMKAKLALLEASPLSSQNPKTFQPKNKGLVTETFDWDEEEVSDEEEVTQVKVLMALVDDELTVGKSHARNGEWVDKTMRKVNTLLSMDEDADWQNYLKYINIDLKFVEEQRLNLLSKYNKWIF
ncbi:hypothetical protein Tco_0458624 [Tanacetum coccineum]